MLIQGLPADAALWRSTPELGGWTVTDHLLASLIETVDVAGWRAFLPHAKKGFKPTPVIVDRPGVRHTQAHRRRRNATPGELRQAFGDVVYAPPSEG